MQIITVERVELPHATLGSWYLGYSDFMLCKTLELPWKDNARSVSCIPYDTFFYMVKESTSGKHKYPHFRILDVPGRSGILVHRLTYVKDLLGCVGVGSAFKDINLDGELDIIDSTLTLNKLYTSLEDVSRIIFKPKRT